jgi:hypothetical protein
LQEPARAAGTPGPQGLCVTQLDKHRWRVDCLPGKPLELRYAVLAYDTSVRTAWLDSRRGFFNGTSLCLRVQGQSAQPCSIDIDAPELQPIALTGIGHSPDASKSRRPRLWPLWRPTTTSWWTARWKWALLERALHGLRRAAPLRGGGAPV